MKGSTLLLALIVLFTFPLWIALIAGGFGLLLGIIGLLFGLFAGAFGLIFGMIGGILKAIFGGIFGWSNHWNFFSFPHFHLGGFEIAAIVIIIALVVSKRNKVKTKNGETEG
jgi:hypothetical protein